VAEYLGLKIGLVYCGLGPGLACCDLGLGDNLGLVNVTVTCYCALLATHLFWLALPTLMTLPSADSDLLMLAPSLSRSPVAPLLSALSEPAHTRTDYTCLLTYLLASSNHADNATVQTSAKVIWQRLHHRRTSTFIYKLYFAKMAARYKKIQKYEIYKKSASIYTDNKNPMLVTGVNKRDKQRRVHQS